MLLVIKRGYFNIITNIALMYVLNLFRVGIRALSFVR
jgi:hypothetical protein